MTLTAHAIVGAAIASTLPQHPLLAFSLAFASHFAVDAIPHYDYHLRSPSLNSLIASPLEYNRALVNDLFKVSFDGLLGLTLSVLLFGASLWILFGVVGGVLPDFFQFVWMRLKREPFSSLQHFHRWIHAKNRLLGRPVFGVISQVVFLAAIVGATKLYF